MRPLYIIVNSFFNPVIHFMPVIMNFQLGFGLNDLEMLFKKFSVDS